jgi:hypothetical protein
VASAIHAQKAKTFCLMQAEIYKAMQEWQKIRGLEHQQENVIA